MRVRVVQTGQVFILTQQKKQQNRLQQRYQNLGLDLKRYLEVVQLLQSVYRDGQGHGLQENRLV